MVSCVTTRGDRWAVRLAWTVALGSLGLMAASLVLLVLDWKAIDSPITAQFSYFIGAAITGVLGLLITARRPRNPIGWSLLAIAVSDTVYVFADFVAIRGLLAGASASGWVEWPATVFNNSAGLGFLLLLFIVLFLPTGRLPGSRWRVAAWVVVAGAALSLIQVYAAEDRRQRDDDDGAIDRRHEHREARVRQGHPLVAGRHQMFCARWAGIGADSDVAEVPDVDGGVFRSLSRGVDGFPTVRFRAH